MSEIATKQTSVHSALHLWRESRPSTVLEELPG